MTFSEYQIEAKKTRIYPDSQKFVYPCLELIDEFSEYLEKTLLDTDVEPIEVVKEISDCWWGLANLLSDLDISMNALFIVSLDEYLRYNSPPYWNNSAHVFILMGQICGKVKKLLRGDYTIFDNDTKNVVINNLQYIGYVLIAIGLSYGYTVGDVLQLNIDKLKDRQSRGVLKGNGDTR
jgi:hypothetical protein